jgi:hypothetical protein
MAWVGRASCTLALLLLWAPRTAHASECSNPLVSTCVNSDTLWPNPGPSRFVGVSGTETVAQGQLGFGLLSTWLSHPVILRVASPGPGGSDQAVVDDQVNGNFLFAYGVTDRLQLDLVQPVTFVQTGAGTSPLTGGRGLHDTAVRDLRFGFAYAIVPRARVSTEAAASEGGPGKAWALTGRLELSAPNGDNDDFAGERTVVYAPSLAADYRVGRFFAGAEVGLRVRPIAEFAGARVGTQLAGGLGVGVDVLSRDRLAVLAEARALGTFAEQHDTKQSAFGITSAPNGKSITPAEWMLSVRSAPLRGSDLAFQLGGGGPIPIGDAAITVPRFRFVLGVVYAPTQRDTDGDGIPDKTDFCPTDAGPHGGTQPGCPGSAPAPAAPASPAPAPQETTP